MKYIEIFLVLSNIFLPGHPGYDHPSYNTTVQEFDDVSLLYRSAQNGHREGSSTFSTDWREDNKLSTPKDAIFETSTKILSELLPRTSLKGKIPNETGLTGGVKQPCSLATSAGVVVSYVEYVEYEVYEYEVSAPPARRKRSPKKPELYTTTKNHQQPLTESPDGFFQTTYANGILSETLNSTWSSNISHMPDLYESTDSVSSMSSTANLNSEQTTSITSGDTDASSDHSSTHDSIVSASITSARTTTDTMINYCKDDTPIDGISLESCPSCQGRCGEVGTVSKAKVLCSCDQTCLVYLDCCPDFELLCPEQYTQGLIVSNSMSGSWDTVCLTLNINDGSEDKYLFISECNGTAYELVLTAGVPKANDGVPVEDLTTSLFFINYDCAKCHGATNLRPMQIKLSYELQQCDMSREHPTELHPNVNAMPRYNESQSGETSGERESLDASFLHATADMENRGERDETMVKLLATSGDAHKIRYAFVGKPTRRCHDGLIDRCSESCSNGKLIELCTKSGFMYTTFDEYRFVTFKNVYCAICFMESDHFTCGNLDYIKSPSNNLPPISTFSLSVLFDFTSGPRVRSVGIICEEDQVILPNDLACGDLVCPDGYVRQNDTCVPPTTLQTLTWDFVYQVVVNTSLGCTLCENDSLVNFNDTRNHVAEQLITMVQNVSENVSIIAIEISCSCANLLQINISIECVPPQSTNFLTTVTQKLEVEGTAIVMNYLLKYLYEANSTVSFSHIIFVAFNSSPVSSEYELPCLGYLILDKDFVVVGKELILRANGHVYQEDEYTLKNGSAFVCYKSVKPDTDDPVSAALAVLTIVLSTLSFSCICVRIIMQFTTSRYKNIANRMQFHLSIALCLSSGLLLISPLASSNTKTCAILAAIKYFSFLASFAWMTCISGDTWWVLKKSESCIKDNPDRSIVKYSLICWLPPLVISVLVLGLDYLPIPSQYKPQLGGSACWIANMSGILIYFVAPVSAFITINMIFFALTSASLRNTFKGSNKVRQTTDKNKEFRVYLKLFILMGLTWAIGIIAPWADTPAVWFLFIIFNASQGMFIFFAFVFDYQILRRLTRNCCPRLEYGDSAEAGEPSFSNSIATSTSQITTVVETG